MSTEKTKEPKPAATLDERGRCCGRKPIEYKRPHHLFCCRCDRSYSPASGSQIENWAWRRLSETEFVSTTKKPETMPHPPEPTHPNCNQPVATDAARKAAEHIHDQYRAAIKTLFDAEPFKSGENTKRLLAERIQTAIDKETAALRREVEALTKERDGWKADLNRVHQAWMRDAGNIAAERDEARKQLQLLKGGDEVCAQSTSNTSTGKSISLRQPSQSEHDTPPKTERASDAAAKSDPSCAACDRLRAELERSREERDALARQLKRALKDLDELESAVIDPEEDKE